MRIARCLLNRICSPATSNLHHHQAALCIARGIRRTLLTSGRQMATPVAEKASALPAEISTLNVVSASDPSKSVRLGDLWADKPLVLVFLRRFGCKVCRVYAQDLEELKPEIEELGARIVLLTFELMGEGSDFDRSWERGKYFTGDVYCDSSKKAHSTLFERKTLWSGYGLFSINKHRMAQIKERGTPGNITGDGFQLGGTFVIDKDGTVVLDHRQKDYGDDPTNEEILTALSSCKGLAPPTKGDAASAGSGAVA